MRTIIFSTAIRVLTPVFLLFSFYILMRGHNHPGGGFIGGLIGSIAFVFHTLAYGTRETAKSYFSITLYKYDRKPDHGKVKHVLRVIKKNILRNNHNDKPKSIWNYYLLKLRPTYIMGLGLSLALLSGVIGLMVGKPFMTGLWIDANVPLVGSLGTPLLFDTGVYLLVLGMILKIVFTMSKD